MASRAAVVFREQALADLVQISSYIARSDPVAASRVIERIHRAIYNTLALLPKCGRLNRKVGAREYPVPRFPYLVIYVITDGKIDVVGVFHTRRDPKSKPRP